MSAFQFRLAGVHVDESIPDCAECEVSIEVDRDGDLIATKMLGVSIKPIGPFTWVEATLKIIDESKKA